MCSFHSMQQLIQCKHLHADIYTMLAFACSCSCSVLIASLTHHHIESQSSVVVHELPVGKEAGKARLFRAICDFQGEDDDDLSFVIGDVILVTDVPQDPKSWWYV